MGRRAGRRSSRATRLASWRKAFGMSSAEAVAVLDAIRDALDGEPLTRDELADAVAERLGERAARRGRARQLRDDAQARRVPRRRRVRPAGRARRCASRARTAGWLRTGRRRRRARRWRTVIRRHLAAYGPASRETFARWFGMPSAAQAGKLIAALGDEVAAVSVEGWEGWMLRDGRGRGGGARARAASCRCCRRSTSTSSRRRARRRRCWRPRTRTASTAGRAGCRRCCSSTGGSPASGATSARAACSA